MLERSGASAIAIHGSFREQRYHEGVADWNAICALKKVVGVPIIANGNILGLDDGHRCLQYTGCDGVMSAISIIRMPKLFESTLFSGRALEISNYNRLKNVKLQMQLSGKNLGEKVLTPPEAGTEREVVLGSSSINEEDQRGDKDVSAETRTSTETHTDPKIDNEGSISAKGDEEVATHINVKELESAQLVASLECADKYIEWASKYVPHD
jgi:hypothetical protein